ncbi:hypothetical protein DMJ13_20745 [halophilic archaeon]|nr:hypothetical protein DMJ13_20745 [halophilic archaeon]
MAEGSNQVAFQQALSELPQFVYGNGLRLAMLSVAWTICSLPLVTVGPATLAVYVAVQDLRSARNTIDRSRIFSILRQNGGASAVFSSIPVIFVTIAILYGIQALKEEVLIGEVIALISGYIGLYVALILIPTFNEMAAGVPPVSALRRGVRWVSSHPTVALTTALLTVIFLVVTVFFTIAFVLLFAGLVVSLHVVIVTELESFSPEGDSEAILAVG